MRFLLLGFFAFAVVAMGGGAARPIRFEQNKGQTDTRYSFLARARGQTAFFGSATTRIELHGKHREIASVEMAFAGSNAKAAWMPAGPATGQINYQLGRDESRWVHDAPQYARLQRKGLYPGVDLTVYDGGEGRIEYDLLLAANADPSKIRLRLDSPWPARALADGSIEVTTSAGVLSQRIPVVYQLKNGQRVPVKGRFIAAAGHEFRLQLGAYDRSLPLVVDPVIESARYYGGELDDEVVITKPDYVVGNTSSVDFLDAITARRGRDVFLLFNNASQVGRVVGANEVYFVYGGSDDDEVTAAAPGYPTYYNGSGRFDVFLAGVTRSRDLPATSEASGYRGGLSDGFLVQMHFEQPRGYPSLTTRSAYWGGSGEDRIQAMSLRNSNMYITGVTDSPDLPVTNGVQPALAGGRDAFVAAYYMGYGTTFCTYLGGTGDDAGWGIQAVLDANFLLEFHVVGETRSPDFPAASADAQGVRRGGSDGFLVILGFALDGPTNGNVTGKYIVRRSRVIGGSQEDSIRFLAGPDDNPGVYQPSSSFLLGGITTSSDFPLKNAAQPQAGGGTDGFVVRYLYADASVVFSTYIGGSGDEELVAGAIRRDLQFLVAGSTRSTNLPVKDAAQPNPGGGLDGFLASYNAEGVLQSATYYGGSGDDRVRGIMTTDSGPVRIAGVTTSADLPGMGPYRKDDGADGFSATIGLGEIVTPTRAVAAKGGIIGIPIAVSQSITTQLTVKVLDPTKLKIWNGSTLVNEIIWDGNSVFVEALEESGETDIEIAGAGFTTQRIRVSLFPGALAMPVFQPSYTIWSRSIYIGVSYCAVNRATNKLEGCGSVRDPKAFKWTSSQPSVADVDSSLGSLEQLILYTRGQTTLTLESELPVFPSRTAVVTVTGATPNTPARIVFGKDFVISTPFNLPSTYNGQATNYEIRLRSSNPEVVALSLDRETYGPEVVQKSYFYPQMVGLKVGETTIVATSPDWDREVVVPVEVRQTFLQVQKVGGIVGSQASAPMRLQYEGGPAYFYGGLRTGFGVRVRVTSSDPVVASLVKDVLTYPAEAITVDCKSVGTATIGIVVEDPPGFEVRGTLVVEVSDPPLLTSIPAEIRTSKNLDTTVSVSYPPNAQGPFTYRVADPSLAGVAVVENAPPAAEVQSTSFQSLIRIAGYATSGSTTLTIRNSERVVATIPILLTPAAIGFSASQVRASINDYLPQVAVSIFGVDSATGIPYGTLRSLPGVSFAARITRRQGESATLTPEAVLVSSTSANLSLQALRPGLTTFTLEGPPEVGLYSHRSRMDVTVEQSVVRLSINRAVQNAYREARVDGVVTGGTPLQLESLDPTKLLLSASPSGQGAASLQVTRGQSFYFVGQDATGLAMVRISGDGYKTLEVQMDVAPLSATVSGPFNRDSSVVELSSGGRAADITVGLGSSNAGIVGLRPGVSYTATLTSSSPAVATVEATTLQLSGGQTSMRTQLSGKAPGSTVVTVRMSPAMPIVGDRLTVNVKRLRFRLLIQNSSTNDLTLAKGMFGFLILQPENGETLQDNVIVRAVSSDPSRLLLARTQEAEPGSSVNIAVAANSNSSPTGLWVHALDSTGTAEIRLSAEGFEDSVATISFDRVRLAWSQSNVEIRAGQQYDASVYFENRGFATGLSARSGPLQLAVKLDPIGIATLSSPTLAIAPGANFGSVAVTARSPGTFALIAELPPGVTAADGSQFIRTEVKVRALQISGYCPPQSRLGKDLTASCQIQLPPGTGFTVTSSNPAALVVSHSPMIVGSGSLSGSVLLNSGSANIFMQGLASSGDATVTVRADGYEDLALKVTLAPTSLLFTADVELNRGAVLVLDAMKLRVAIATLGDTGAPQITGQVLRAGAGPLVVPLSNSNSAVIRVQPASATIAGGESSGEVLVTPVGTGTSVLTMQPPSGWLANGTGSVLFDVQLKPLPFAWLWPLDTYPLPKDLLAGVFNTAFQSGIPITITTSDPSKMLVQLYSGQGGDGEVVSATSPDMKEFLIVGVADSGTADVIVTSPGYLPQRHSVRLGPSALILVDGNQNFRGPVSVNPPGKRSVEVYLGGVKTDGSMSRVFNYFRRATGPLAVTLTSSVANVVRPVVTTVTIPNGLWSAKFDVDIIAAGTATLRASTPGYPATPVLDELTYNVTVAPSTATKLFSCLGAGVTAALDMVSSQCVYTGTGSGTVTATVQDPTIVGLSFDDGPVGVSLSSPTTPRVLRVHGLKVGQSVVVLSGPGVPSTTMVVNVVRPFLSFVEPASGTLNVARGSEGTVKLQALVENYSPGIYTMRPGANLQAIPLSTVGNTLTIRGTQGAEVRFAVGQDTAEFRIIAAEVGVTTLRLGYSGPFTAPPGGYKTEILVNSR